MQITLGVMRGRVRPELVLEQQRQKAFEIDVRGLERGDELLLLRLDVADACGVIRRARHRDGGIAHFEHAIAFRFDLPRCRQNGRAEHCAKRFGIGGTRDFLVAHRIDIATASLHEESHRAAAECFLDDFGSKAWIIGGAALARRIHDGMTGELIEHGQGCAIRTIQAQQTDLRINRSHTGDLLIKRH